MPSFVIIVIRKIQKKRTCRELNNSKPKDFTTKNDLLRQLKEKILKEKNRNDSYHSLCEKLSKIINQIDQKDVTICTVDEVKNYVKAIEEEYKKITKR